MSVQRQIGNSFHYGESKQQEPTASPAKGGIAVTNSKNQIKFIFKTRSANKFPD